MKKRYRNVSFLVELLINILVFSISCAVLVGLFGKAWQLARQTRQESEALGEVHALLEEVKAADGQYPDFAVAQADGSRMCYYDASWAPQSGETDAAAYTVRLVVDATDSEAGLLLQLEVEAKTGDGQLLCQLETASYQPKERGAAA